MNILSLFDGISCGQQAITNLGIKDYTYFSSEIDKFAIRVTQENFPNTIQIGDVTQVKGEDYNDVTILLGGSPCQGFSFAGKQLAFDDPRSKLFFEYVRILKEVKPKYFLLENVRMKKEYQDVISEHLFGIQPILIDSANLVAQSRKRLYWVGQLQEDGTYKQVNIEQPEDKGVLLKDILEDEVDEKYYKDNIKKHQISRLEYNLRDNNFSSFNQDNVFCGIKDKVPTLTAGDGGNRPKIHNRLLTPLECERLQGVKPGYTSCVSNSQRYKMLGNGWTIPIIEWILSYFNLKK